MKKILLIGAIFIVSIAKSQTKDNSYKAAGIAGCMIGTGLVTAYFVANKNSEKDYVVQPISESTKWKIRKSNAPFLLTGAGCIAIGVISFIEGSNINVSIGKNTKAGIIGTGIGISYAIK